MGACTTSPNFLSGGFSDRRASSYFQSSLPVFKSKRSQKGPLTRTEVQDDLPAMEDRGGTVAIFITHFTEVRFPKFFAVEVVAKDPGRAVPDNHARAVSRGRGPAVRIRLVRRLNSGKLNRPHPKFPARSAVEAIQVSPLARVFRTSDKDAPMRNDGAAVTRTWECRLPADVIRRSPMERRFVLLSCDTGFPRGFRGTAAQSPARTVRDNSKASAAAV